VRSRAHFERENQQADEAEDRQHDEEADRTAEREADVDLGQSQTGEQQGAEPEGPPARGDDGGGPQQIFCGEARGERGEKPLDLGARTLGAKEIGDFRAPADRLQRAGLQLGQRRGRRRILRRNERRIAVETQMSLLAEPIDQRPQHLVRPAGEIGEFDRIGCARRLWEILRIAAIRRDDRESRGGEHGDQHAGVKSQKLRTRLMQKIEELHLGCPPRVEGGVGINTTPRPKPPCASANYEVCSRRACIVAAPSTAMPMA